LREGVRVLAQALMEAEVSAQIGAEHSERTLSRVTHRNGYRLRDWDTRAGTIELAIPGCARAAICRRSWNHAGGPSGRWPRWWLSVMWRACRPGGSTTSPARWGWMGSASRRLQDVRRAR
jgi:hypothetical protein